MVSTTTCFKNKAGYTVTVYILLGFNVFEREANVCFQNECCYGNTWMQSYTDGSFFLEFDIKGFLFGNINVGNVLNRF